MNNIALRVSYNGAPFCGFAKQPKTLTVQGELEQALSLLYKRTVEIVCAGRTDTGVHALSQVVNFFLNDDEVNLRSLETLRRSLNGIIHESIAVTGILFAPETFSARFDATSREYRYYISDSRFRPVLLDTRAWHVRHPVNDVKMNEAAQLLVGEHDFKSFCMAVSATGKPTRRTLLEVGVSREMHFGEELVVVRVLGSSFLHSMVRTIVGSLVEIGLGKQEASWLEEIVDAKDRQAAGQNAPAQGLVFWNVNYPDNLNIKW